MACSCFSVKLNRYNQGGFMSGLPKAAKGMRMDDGGSFYTGGYGYDRIKQRDEGSDIAGGIGKGLGSTGIPWLQAIGAGVSGQSKLGKMTTDSSGLYKSKGAEVLDTTLDFSKYHSMIHDNLTELKAGDFNAQHALNQQSFGIFGKSAEQERLREAKRQQENQNALAQVHNTDIAGALSRASLDGYQAPAYGSKGMKMKKPKTKFSR